MEKLGDGSCRPSSQGFGNYRKNILELLAGGWVGMFRLTSTNIGWKEGISQFIRQNWHLLTYEQILTLLDWTDEKLQFTLKEDDFLYHKLGMFKPYVEKAIYRPLTEEENARTEELREILKTFPRKSTHKFKYSQTV